MEKWREESLCFPNIKSFAKMYMGDTANVKNGSMVGTLLITQKAMSSL